MERSESAEAKGEAKGNQARQEVERRRNQYSFLFCRLREVPQQHAGREADDGDERVDNERGRRREDGLNRKS